MPEPDPLPSDSIISMSPSLSRTTWNWLGEAPGSLRVPALLELGLAAATGVYEPPVMLCCAHPLEVSSSSTPEEMVPLAAAVKVPTAAVAWLLLSYPENWKA